MMHLWNEDGIALISVLWGILILSTLSMSVMSLGTKNRSVVHNTYEYQKAHYALDEAMQNVLGQLTRQDAPQYVSNGVTTYSYNISGMVVNVELMPEEGKIDLNTSDTFMISGLVAYHGLSNDLSMKIAEWVTENRQTSEEPFFKSVEEVSQIRDLPLELYSCIEPYLTVHSGRNGVDMSLATPEMIEFVEWADQHRWGGENWINADGTTSGRFVSSLGENPRKAKSYAGKVFTIRATVSIGNRLGVSNNAIVRITGDIRHPYWVYNESKKYTDSNNQCEYL